MHNSCDYEPFPDFDFDPYDFFEEDEEDEEDEDEWEREEDDEDEDEMDADDADGFLLSDEYNPDDFDSSAFEAPDDIWRDSDFTRDYDDYSYREEFPDGIEGDAAYDAWLDDADD